MTDTDKRNSKQLVLVNAAEYASLKEIAGTYAHMRAEMQKQLDEKTRRIEELSEKSKLVDKDGNVLDTIKVELRTCLYNSNPRDYGWFVVPSRYVDKTVKSIELIVGKDGIVGYERDEMMRAMRDLTSVMKEDIENEFDIRYRAHLEELRKQIESLTGQNAAMQRAIDIFNEHHLIKVKLPIECNEEIRLETDRA